LSTEPLKPSSYVMLALIGQGGAAPHDLVDMIRRGGRLFYAAAPSQIYAEPKRLEQLGYVRSRREPGRTHDRTVYELTERGREELRAWLAEPAPFPRIQNEANIRLLAGDLIDDGTIVQSFVAMREELDELERLVAEGEAVASEVPHRERYLRLSFSLARKLLAAHREWVDEIERELGEPGA
jgi:PadR family transcriptional regulator, regulatory protein AphA